MARNILKVKLAWTGFQGGPGVSNFYFGDFTDQPAWIPTQAMVDAAAVAVTTFATALQDYIAPTVRLQVQQDCDLIQDSDASIQGSFTAAAQGVKPSTAQSGSAYSAASGAVIDWKTAEVRNRRRIQGRTFLVPLAQTAYESDGTIAGGALNAFGTAAAALVNGTGYPDFGVWSRPRKAKGPDGKPTGPVLPNGQFAIATAVKVPDMSAVLRSRRN